MARRLKSSFMAFWQKYKFRSIVVKSVLKLFLVFFLIMIIPIGLTYMIITGNIQKQIVEDNFTINRKIGATTESVFRDVEYIASALLYDTDVLSFVSVSDKDWALSEYKTMMVEKINNYMSGKMLIDSIYLYSSLSDLVCDGNNMVDAGSFYDISWMEEAKDDLPGKCIVIARKIEEESEEEKLYNEKSEYVFTLVKKHKNNSCVAINVDVQGYEKFISEQVDSESVFYIAQTDSVMYTHLFKSQRDDEIENKILQMITENENSQMIKTKNKKFSAVAEKSEYYDWYYVRTLDYGPYQSQIRGIYYLLIIILMLVIMIVIVVSVVLSVNNVSQVLSLLDLFENRDSYDNLSENEIGEVARKIIRLMDDNEMLKDGITKRNDQYERLKLRALQTQITPHFLNNTLAVINYEIFGEFKKENRISSMLSKLSSILGYTLISDRIVVNLEEELSFIRNYADLLKLRYGNVEIEIEADEKALKSKILRMCIQPLMENAVFHGIKERGGKVYIKCSLCDDALDVVIEDNGGGISNEKLLKIQESFEDDSMGEESVGMKNIYKRLKIVFGEKTEMQIESECDKFTRIVIHIPQNMIDGKGE